MRKCSVNISRLTVDDGGGTETDGADRSEQEVRIFHLLDIK